MSLSECARHSENHHGRKELLADRCSHFYDHRAFAACPRSFGLGYHDQRRGHSAMGKLARSGGRWRARSCGAHRFLNEVLVTTTASACPVAPCVARSPCEVLRLGG
jgi:hypothetical protein